MKQIWIQNQNSKIAIGESHKNWANYVPEKRCFLICDENIYQHYLEFVEEFDFVVISPGEENKIWKTVDEIVKKLLLFHVDRNCFLLGMGGGVVCDITGFVASVLMRGLEFGFISTSLLSQADASVGGKNGINFGNLKNMIGTFNAPQFVICDPFLLKTLPEKEVRNGFAEIIKHALIKDRNLFDFLENNSHALLKLEPLLIEELLFRTISIKANIVENDPFEKSERKILNFGHSIGHAIELSSKLSHGESVAIGMVWAAKFSEKLCQFPKQDYLKIVQILRNYGLPVKSNVSAQSINRVLTSDKKRNSSSIDFILLKQIGNAVIKSIPLVDINSKICKEI